MKKPFHAFVFLLLLFQSQSYSQIAGADSAACNAQFAQLLVEQQVMESKSVAEPVKRIKILLRSADFLWKFDQPTARTYLAEAWKMADDRFKETGFEKKESGEKGKGMMTILPDQRMEVVRAISKLDAEWAKKLSEQMLADYDKSPDNRKDFDKTRELEDLLRLAWENSKTNPELSRHLFRRVMKYPLFNNWFFALYSVAKEDAVYGDSLYSEVLRNYRESSPRRLLFLSAYPFANRHIFGPDKFSIDMGTQEHLSQNPVLQGLFLETFFTRIAIYAASPEEMNQVPEKYYAAEPVYMASALNDIEPIVIRQFPDLIQKLSLAKAQAASLLNSEMKKSLDEKEKWTGSLGRTFEEQLAEMEKADSEGKLTDYMILQLLTKGNKTEEQFKKIEPWLEKVKDEDARRGLINYFWHLRAQLAIKEKRWDDADKFTNKVPEVEHKALLMFEMAAVHAKNATDISSLFDTLNRLSKLIKSVDNSVAKAQILLGLANMYEKVNHSVALDELGEAIRVTNTMKDVDIFANQSRREINGKDFGFFATFNTPGYNLEETFVELSKKDFEMSLAYAKALDDKYYRTLAVIAVAGNCAKNSKPTAKPVRSQ